MSDTSTPLTWRSLPMALVKSRLVQVILVLALVVELYDMTALPAFTATQKAREEKAIADNAALRQKAEADLAEQKSLNEGEVAKNAERKQAAEAHKTTALADKTRYEARIAEAISDYADMQAKFDAKAQEAQAELTKQNALIQNELNIYVERRKKVEADQAKEEAEQAELTNQIQQCGMNGCGR